MTTPAPTWQAKRQPTTVAQALAQTLSLLARKDAWTRGATARDKRGERVIPASPVLPSEVEEHYGRMPVGVTAAGRLSDGRLYLCFDDCDIVLPQDPTAFRKAYVGFVAERLRTAPVPRRQAA